MAKSIGALIQDYIKANRARHNQYARRSKMGKDKWTKADQKKLDAARKHKLAVSKVLRETLKKNGLCILWGDCNQIINIQLIERKKRMEKERKKQRDKWKIDAMKRSLDPLDLVY